MPSNPLTQEEINEYAIGRILNPPGYTGLSPYMPQGYFLSTPSSGDGPALWRLFDASFISSGTISPDRLGSGSVGLGNLYLADDGTWKAISIPATPTLHQVTTAGNVTTNAISVGGLTVATNLIYTDLGNGRVGVGTVSPSSKLHVETGISDTELFRVINPGAGGSVNRGAGIIVSMLNTQVTGGRTRIRQYDTAGYAVRNFIEFVSGNTGFTAEGSTTISGWNEVGLVTNNALRLLVASTGNVLINTTTDAGYKLDVNGTIRATDNAFFSSNKGLYFGNSGYGILGETGIGTLKFYTNSTERLKINNSGVITAGGNARFANIGLTGSNIEMFNGLWYFNIENDGYGLQIKNVTNANTVPLRIFKNDNVAIGTTTDAGYKLDVNGTTRVQTTLTAGQNSGTSYNHLFDAGLGGITFRRFDSYVTSNFITITQPNYGTSANGSMLYIDSPSNTKASGFAHLKLAGPYNGGGSTYLQVGNASTITSTHVSLAKFHTGNLQYIGPTYGGANTFMGLDIRVEGQTANYSVSTATKFVGIYIQSSFNNAYSTSQLPIDSWKTFVDNSTLSNIVTPFTSIDIAPIFNNASNAVTSYGININPTLNSYTGFVALRSTVGNVQLNTTSGNTLIGTTTDSGYKLEVAGNIGLSGTLVPTAGVSHLGTFTNRFGDVWASGLIVGTTFYGDNHQSASGYLFFKEGGGVEKMRMTPGGNFLIGTGVDAGYKLDVNGTGIFRGVTEVKSVNDARILLTNDGVSNPMISFVDNLGAAQYAHLKFYDLVFKNDTTTFAKIFNTGNFGIGTTTDAGQKLQVLGNSRFFSSVDTYHTIESTATGSAGTIYKNTYHQYFTGTNYATANSWEVYDLTAGAPVIHVSGPSRAVGINKVNASYQLDVEGAFRTTQGAYLATSSGFVGIGTTSPVYLLDVNGTINSLSGYAINGTAGWTGTISNPLGPVGQQNIQVQGGIIVNVY